MKRFHVETCPNILEIERKGHNENFRMDSQSHKAKEKIRTVYKLNG